MRRGSKIAAGACLTALFFGGPGLAQEARPDASPARAASPGSDQTFLLGLRRIGVVAGHAVTCAADNNKKAVIESATDLAKEIALQFGLNAAFQFVGAVGYGTGRPFDMTTCKDASAEWSRIQQKYLEQ
jgi:hypothetical protein